MSSASFFLICWEKYQADVRAEKRRKAYFRAALAFNRIHTYATHDGLWMCPECNAIHEKIGMSVFVGLLFPACCKAPEGERTDEKRYATDTNWKLP